MNDLAFIGLAIAALAVGVALFWIRRSKVAATPTGPSPPERISLERQIADFATAGLHLNAGVTMDDLLHSFPRGEFEATPYSLLLFMFGVEIERAPWGRPFSKVAWNFDYECIDDPGSYTAIVNQLARITGRANIVSNVADNVDLDAPAATITYTIGGARRSVEAAINDDWADAEAVHRIAEDITNAIGDGRKYWAADNGQAVILFFINDETAAKVNALTKGALTPY